MVDVERSLDAVIVNPASIFRPYGSRYTDAELVRKVRQSWILPYFTGELRVVQVENLVDAILATLQSGTKGQRYILGGENLTVQSLAQRSATAMGLRRRFVPVIPPVTHLTAAVLEPLGRTAEQSTPDYLRHALLWPSFSVLRFRQSETPSVTLHEIFRRFLRSALR